MAKRRKMAEKTIGRRSCTKEFKAEAATLAEKKEKPISHAAKDLGLNENVLRRRIHQYMEGQRLGARQLTERS